MDTSEQILRAFELDYASCPMSCSLKNQSRAITFKTCCRVYDSEKAWVSQFKFKSFNKQAIEDLVKNVLAICKVERRGTQWLSG